MADITVPTVSAVSTPLKQWTFEKHALVRPERSESAASSPDLFHNDGETLRLDASAPVDDAMSLDTKDTLSFQERYMSSEEDLSPNEGDSDSDFDDDVSIHEPEKEYLHARKISIAKFDKGKSCDKAVVVSIVSAGRPKMIQLANLGSSPVSKPSQRSQRSASLAQLPIAVMEKLRNVEQSPRLSLAVSPTASSPLTSRSPSPAASLQPRRHTPSPAPSSRKDSSLHSSNSSFTESSRSSSPWARERIAEPSSAHTIPSISPWASARRPATASNPPIRSTLSISTAPPQTQPKLAAPLTPPSPEPHAFLSSDPYETSTVSSASPIIKSSPHKRLRSISQKLSLAKIAISPSKKWDSRVNGKSATSPPMPLTPFTPHTPQTAPPTSFSTSSYRLRRNSKISRPNSRVGTPITPEVPPLPAMIPEPQSRLRMQKMVPRGANEREPLVELPPFPPANADEDPAATLKARRIRKRRSLMDLL